MIIYLMPIHERLVNYSFIHLISNKGGIIIHYKRTVYYYNDIDSWLHNFIDIIQFNISFTLYDLVV